MSEAKKSYWYEVARWLKADAAPMGAQLRMALDQRAGFCARAFGYSA